MGLWVSNDCFQAAKSLTLVRAIINGMAFLLISEKCERCSLAIYQTAATAAMTAS